MANYQSRNARALRKSFKGSAPRYPKNIAGQARKGGWFQMQGAHGTGDTLHYGRQTRRKRVMVTPSQQSYQVAGTAILVGGILGASAAYRGAKSGAGKLKARRKRRARQRRDNAGKFR